MARIRLDQLQRWKAKGTPWVCLTAYDAPTARILEGAGVPMILVGDSVGNAVLGHDSTVPVTLEDMIHHSAAVRRGAAKTFVVTDMPFLTAQINDDEAIRNAGRLVQQGGADAVKIEGGGCRAETIHRIAEAGIPVMGHLGLTPQNATQLGGYRVQGNSPESAQQILDDAIALEKAGAFALVLECVPSSLAEKISATLKIPVIGIGAGRNVDAQVLVFHDLVGLSGEFKPRFVRRYAQGEQLFQSAVKSFIDDVSSGSFPADSETFLDRDGENSEMTPEV